MYTLQNNQKIYKTLADYLHGGRLPHALLLEGPQGCGKRTLATEIAQGSLCTAPLTNRPCGECRDCIKVSKGVHPDLLLYGEDQSSSRSFHIDLVRQLRSEAYIRPNEGQYKIFVLENVQNMTIQAQNALLKILEEPPKNVHFVLTCENKALLLETILSRVIVLTVLVPDTQACIEILEKFKPGLEQNQYRMAAGQADNSVGKALALLEAQSEKDSLYRYGQEVFTALCIGNELDALSILSQYERDRAGLLQLLDAMKGVAVELLEKKQLLSPELSRLVNRVTPLQLMRILAIIEELVAALQGNVGGLLLVTAVCSKIKLALAES